MKKVLLIANFESGKQSVKEELPDIITGLALARCETTVYPILPNNDLNAEEIIAKRSQDFDAALVCGGDGTLNHTINGIMKSGSHIPIGYIPTGSTNDFARSINHGKIMTIPEVCQAVAGDKSFVYDIGKINDVYFNYIAAFGAFTKVSYDTSQEVKNILGYSAYILNMIANIPDGLSYRVHMQVEHDGEMEEDDYIFGGVCNTLSIGGVETPFLSDAQLNDGKMECILIKAPDNLIDLNATLSAVTNGRTSDPRIQVINASHFVFRSDKAVTWTLDGEKGETTDLSTVDVCPGAMKIMVL